MEALLSGLTAWLPREPGSRNRRGLVKRKRFQVSSNMERRAQRQRGGDREVTKENGLVETQWGEAEVIALVSVWNEVGAQHLAESRGTYELISERLRRLSVVRSWWECQAKCRSLGLQSSKSEEEAGPADYTPRSPGMDARPVEGWEEEVDGVGNTRGIYPSLVTIPMQEGKWSCDHKCSVVKIYRLSITYM